MALPYAIDALEPVISKQTLEFHHGKHLAGYVNNLNGLLEGSPLAGLPLEEIVCMASGGILNKTSAHSRHSKKRSRRQGLRCLALAGFGCRQTRMENW